MGKGDNKSPPAQEKRSHRDSLLILTCWLLRNFSDQCGALTLGDGPNSPPPPDVNLFLLREFYITQGLTRLQLSLYSRTDCIAIMFFARILLPPRAVKV
jgi:hypothetical protein